MTAEQPASDSALETTMIGAADSDGDGVQDGADCAPANPAVWAIPGEATGLAWNIPQGEMAPPGALAFSPDGRWLASAHADNIVRIWDSATGQLYRKIATQYQTGNLAFAPNSIRLATGELAADSQAVTQ